MTIPLTGTGGLFTRLGKVGKLLYLANSHQASLPAAMESLFTQCDGITPPTGVRDLIASTVTQKDAIIANQSSWMGGLQSFAQSLLLRMANSDDPSIVTPAAAVSLLIKQMVAASATVKSTACGVSSTALSPVGDGVLVTSATKGDGSAPRMFIPETARFYCSNDSYSGSASAGNEGFAFAGAAAAPSVWDYSWPAGSGASADYTAVSPTNGTVLLNGGMTNFTTNVPDGWTVESGAAGINFFKETGTTLDGTALKIVGGTTATRLSQSFGVTGGNTFIPTPLAPYALNFWIRTSGVPAAGTVQVDLADGTANVVTDSSGTNNYASFDLTAIAANTWIAKSCVFRLPKAIPAGLKLRFQGGCSAGTNLFVDRICLAPMIQPYAGSPYLAVFSGATPFVQGDSWSVAVTNDFGGASYAATFQALFERLFGLQSMGFQLPSASSPTIADTLITG